MNKERLRALQLLAPAVIGMVVALVTALALVPRVRAVEVIAIFGSSFGSGAAFAVALVEFRKSRRMPLGVHR